MPKGFPENGINRGWIKSEETKKKISEHSAKFWLGKKLSKEHKRKLSEALACEEFWNINNGRTLCKECHNKTKGWKND